MVTLVCSVDLVVKGLHRLDSFDPAVLQYSTTPHCARLMQSLF